MFKIKTIGLTVLTGTILAFGAPLAAHAAPSTTPNKDAFCAVNSVPAMVTALTATLVTQTATHAANVLTVTQKEADVTLATSSLSSAVLGYITAKDGTDASALSIAQTTFNTRSADFGTAVSSWLDAHIAEVNSNNAVLGSTFLLNYENQVAGLVCI
ncbi:MAG: hypothetical protein QOH66_2899 [Actinomycetota bacterium]|jgi:hypothetical protein|nr:hypothetical protein [Actinomycetota bacterium]